MAASAVIVVHGGAGAWAQEAASEAGAGIRRALQAGWEVLGHGGDASESVEAAVLAMEDDPTFNAGRGSCLTSDGRVQMDALIMDGARLDAGAVACVERIRNPIRLARAIQLRGQHVLFAGADAERFAETMGFELCANEQLITDRQRQRWREAIAGAGRESPLLQAEGTTGDTVGAVAVDAAGSVASATSTGGMHGKAPGRVGDSPLVGCGGYADNRAGAVSATGWGEAIMKLTLARWTADRMQEGIGAQRATEMAIDHLAERLNGTGGLIAVNPAGEFGAAKNTAGMPWGMKSADRELVQEL
jgi:L-asparaginase / beta-aspartyl-peptidase